MESLFDKVARLKAATPLKRDSNTGLFLHIAPPAAASEDGIFYLAC